MKQAATIPTQPKRNFLITAEQVYQQKKVTIEELYIESHDVWVNMRVPDARRRGKFEALVYMTDQAKSIPNMRQDFAIMCLCDARGKYLFDDDDLEAAREKLGELDCVFLDPIMAKAQQMLNITVEDINDAQKKS